ncbi:MAG: pentapeptide repeat-containing protein [Bacteroidetes bacterium]|nr:pentapeptide repeat-containing protein [Bacteroidota bacterium]
MFTRLIICFAFCFSFYSCSSIGDQKVSSEKLRAHLSLGEDVSYKGYTITGDFDLIDTGHAVAVSPVISDVYIRSAIVFRNCTFKGKLMASRRTGAQGYTATFGRTIFFEDCVFDDEVNFEGATVNGICNFLKCTFKKGGLFNRATFNGMASFTNCAFMEDAGFQQCSFAGNSYFNESHFYRAGFFQNSYFYREFTFNMVNCDGYMDFSLASFYSIANCNYAHFKKNAVFNDASFRGKTQFVGSEFVRAEYEGCLFYSRSNFDKSTFSESLTLKDAKFLSSRPQTTGYKASKLDISGAEVSGAKMTEF